MRHHASEMSPTKRSGPVPNALKKGEYAGVPENMLDVPLPHVPHEKRMAVLNKLLSDMRKSYIQEQVCLSTRVATEEGIYTRRLRADRPPTTPTHTHGASL